MTSPVRKTGFFVAACNARACLPKAWRGSPHWLHTLATAWRGSPDGAGRIEPFTRYKDVLYILCFQHKTSCSKGQARGKAARVGPDEGFYRPMVPQRLARGMPPHGRSVSSPLDVAGSNPAIVSNDVAQVVRAPSNTERWFTGLQIQKVGVGHSPIKCPSLKAMLDPPVMRAALECAERPASVLRITHCTAAAHEHPSPERIGTTALHVQWR